MIKITNEMKRVMTSKVMARLGANLTVDLLNKKARKGIAEQQYLENQRVRRNDNLRIFLRENDLNEIYYYKENIRIYFKVRKKSRKIYKLEVVEFNPEWIEENPDIEEKFSNQYKGYSHIGNTCIQRWKWETCAHVIYNLFTYYGFEDKKLEKEALFELSKIFEFRLEIAEILFRFTEI